MLRKGAAEGELEALCLRPGESRSLPSLDGAERLLFCVRGACAARDGERLAALPAGRTLRFDGAAELAAGAAGAVLMQLRFRLL